MTEGKINKKETVAETIWGSETQVVPRGQKGEPGHEEICLPPRAQESQSRASLLQA